MVVLRWPSVSHNHHMMHFKVSSMKSMSNDCGQQDLLARGDVVYWGNGCDIDAHGQLSMARCATGLSRMSNPIYGKVPTNLQQTAQVMAAAVVKRVERVQYCLCKLPHLIELVRMHRSYISAPQF